MFSPYQDCLDLLEDDRKKIKNIFAEAEEEIYKLQMQEEELGFLSPEDATRLSSLSTSRTHLLVQQECYWRQRARINWLTQLW